MNNKPIIDIIMEDTFKKEPTSATDYYSMMYFGKDEEIVCLLSDKNYKPLPTFDGDSFLIKLFKGRKLKRFDDIFNLAMDNKYILSTINEVSKQGQTPLMVAVEQSLSNEIDVLLSHGANVNVLTYGNKTLAMLAVEECNYLDVIKILDKNPDLINKLDNSGNNILHYVAQNRFNDMHKWAFNYDLTSLINRKNDVGNTPILMGSFSNSRVENFKCLVELGADLTIKNSVGESVLDALSNKDFHSSQLQCFCYLVERGDIQLKLRGGCEILKNNFTKSTYAMLESMGKISVWNAQYTKKALLNDINNVVDKENNKFKKPFKM